jgi:hypothetical protein
MWSPNLQAENERGRERKETKVSDERGERDGGKRGEKLTPEM